MRVIKWLVRFFLAVSVVLPSLAEARLVASSVKSMPVAEESMIHLGSVELGEAHTQAAIATAERSLIAVTDTSPAGLVWQERFAAPDSRYGHAMAYDSQRGKVALFGGDAGVNLNDTWEWDRDQWLERAPATHPSGRTGPAMAYDSERAVSVLFGGVYWIGGTQYLEDTWEWDGSEWSERSLVNHPSGREGHTISYIQPQAANQNWSGMVLFGGRDSSFIELDDFWELGPPLREPVLAPIVNPEADGQYSITWSSTTNTITYTLQESTDESFLTPTLAYEGNSTAFQVSAQLGGTWYYRVWAANAEGESNWSNVQSTQVIPEPPSLLPIDNPNNDDSYLVDWTDSQGTITYTLEEDSTPAFSSPLAAYVGGESQHQVTAQEGGAWYYRVRAANDGGSSDWSNTELTYVRPTSPTLDPIVNPDGDRVFEVVWSSVTSAITYTLEHDNDQGFPSPQIRCQDDLTACQIVDQPPGDWYFRVSAANAWGSSDWSNVELASVKPFSPTLLPIDNPAGNGDYLIAWDPAEGANEYTVEEDENPVFPAPTVIYQGQLTYTQVLSQPGGRWYYRVLGTNSAGDGPWSNTEYTWVRPEAPDLYPIDNPDGDGSYLVDWSAATGALTYTLEVDQSPDFGSPEAVFSGPETEFQVEGQSAGVSYYRVQASNPGGDSLWSQTASVTVWPDQVHLLPIENPDGDGNYQVEWLPVTGAITYTLEEDDNDLFTSPVIRYAGISTTTEILGQVAGTWYYRLKASNEGGDSPWSNVESVSVRPATPSLHAIDNPYARPDYQVSWGAVTGAVAYTLQEDESLSFSSPTVRYEGQDTEYDVAHQPIGTWYYRVRASNAGGSSAWSAVKSTVVEAKLFVPLISLNWPPMPQTPVLAPISNSDQDNHYTVSWGPSENAYTYVLEEATNPAFSGKRTVYQGAGTFWTVPEPGKTPTTYYYRVKARNPWGESDWSIVRGVTIYPLFVGLYLRWDGVGYIRADQWYDVGYHLTRDLDVLTDGDTIRSRNYDWYDPNPMGWPASAWNTFYSVSTGYFKSSSAPPNPDWKWGYSWILPYDLAFYNGQTVSIDGQVFNVSGPYSGYTPFGKPVDYWKLVNRHRFLFWDGGADWKQYVEAGDAQLRYDAGNTRLLLYEDVLRTDYYQDEPTPYTVRYIVQLTESTSFPEGAGLSEAGLVPQHIDSWIPLSREPVDPPSGTAIRRDDNSWLAGQIGATYHNYEPAVVPASETTSQPRISRSYRPR